MFAGVEQFFLPLPSSLPYPSPCLILRPNIPNAKCFDTAARLHCRGSRTRPLCSSQARLVGPIRIVVSDTSPHRYLVLVGEVHLRATNFRASKCALRCVSAAAFQVRVTMLRVVTHAPYETFALRRHRVAARVRIRIRPDAPRSRTDRRPACEGSRSDRRPIERPERCIVPSRSRSDLAAMPSGSTL